LRRLCSQYIKVEYLSPTNRANRAPVIPLRSYSASQHRLAFSRRHLHPTGLGA
jgi:hypothetical protein